MPAVVKALLAAAAALASDGHPRGGGAIIDRRALVARHNARITCATLDDEECSGLNFQTLGNGAFALYAHIFPRITPAQRTVVGFPSVESDYWTPTTIAAVSKRYPGIDWAEYKARL